MSQPPGGPNDPGGYYPPQGGNNPGSSPLSNITVTGWGVLGSAILTFIASLLPWWHVSVSILGIESTDSASGWNRFWILVPLLALAIGVVYALSVFKVIPAQPKLGLLYVYGGLAAFVLTILALIDTATYGGEYEGSGVSSGPSFGVFFALITTAALTYFGALAAQESGQKLPIKVPGLPVK